jgi:hypothetical protein
MRHLALLWIGLAVAWPAQEPPAAQTPIEPGFIEIRARPLP